MSAEYGRCSVRPEYDDGAIVCGDISSDKEDHAASNPPRSLVFSGGENMQSK